MYEKTPNSPRHGHFLRTSV